MKKAVTANFWNRAASSNLPSQLRLFSATPAPEEIEVFVNDVPVSVPKGSSVLQACDAIGIDIPRFCYHPKLSIAGNCRMCLVEVFKSPKPVASCAMPAAPGMRIKTDTPLIKKAREGVMEFLLINHPLDCPICDQGGECDLQDQSMYFGSDRSRFVEAKRAVEDKNLGPLVKTVMTRCIHCTRCVRFAKEVAGVEDLGMTGRGKDSEIGTYVEKMMTSELSGNVIDICPVGALTSKPYAFTYRAWELKQTESIDVSDGLGAAIRVDTRGTEVMRITPRVHEAVNEEWLSDKGRFQYDGLKRQRLDVPMIKGPNGLAPTDWLTALSTIAARMQGIPGSGIRAIAGKLADGEAMVALRDVMHRLGCEDLRHEALPPSMCPDVRSNYIANSTVQGLDDADMVILLGTNPRTESPVFNARLKKAVDNGCKVGVIGPAVDLTYPYVSLGEGPEDLEQLLQGGGAMESITAAQRPALIVGSSVLRRPDAPAVMSKVHELVEAGGFVRDDWNGYNIFHDNASAVAALDVGFAPSLRPDEAAASPQAVFLLGADDYDDADVPPGAFVVYQGHHGDKGAMRADVILPGCAYTEKRGTYVNFEGRVQRTAAAATSVGDARTDWKIGVALGEALGVPLPYSTAEGVADRMAEIAPHLGRRGAVEAPVWLNGVYFDAVKPAEGGAGVDASVLFRSSVDNFYMTDAISRASRSMARCVQARGEQTAPSL